MGHDKNGDQELDATREALASWRRSHGGRGRPIPGALWLAAANVARAKGVAETARALRLNLRKLGKLAEGRTASAWGSAAEPAGFVELSGVGLGERDPGTVVFELVGREGDRVRVELVGGAGGAPELLALARAFWSRNG